MNLTRTRWERMPLVLVGTLTIAAAASGWQQGVPSQQPGPKNQPTQPGPRNTPSQPGPKNPNPTPGDNNQPPASPRNPDDPVDPNDPTRRSPSDGVPPGALPAGVRYRGPFSFQDPQSEARFYDASHKLYQMEAKLARSNEDLLKRLGDVRSLPPERQSGALYDLLQQMIRDNAMLHQYLAQSRTAWSGEFDFPPENDPAGDRRGGPAGNSESQTPPARGSDTPRDNPRR